MAQYKTLANGVVEVSFDAKDMERMGITQEDLDREAKLYCDCDVPDDEPYYKPDGKVLMGVRKHGWVCHKCNKFVQIG